MKIYQLQDEQGVNRAKKNFKNKDDALSYQNRLIRYIVDRINEGQLGYRNYLQEAKDLNLVEIEIKKKQHFFSICEYAQGATGIVKTFTDRNVAEDYLKRLSEGTERVFDIMESKVNDYRKDNPSQG